MSNKVGGIARAPVWGANLSYNYLSFLFYFFIFYFFHFLFAVPPMEIFPGGSGLSPSKEVNKGE